MHRARLVGCCLLAASCAFDWDAFDPRLAEATTGAGGGSGGAPGECVEDGAPCGDASESPCDAPDTCLGGTCQENLAERGAPCNDATATECTQPDSCDGQGACLDNHVAAGMTCTDCGAVGCSCAGGTCVDCPSSANELTTLYMFNNGTAGIMFDVVAMDDVVIDGFDVNLAAGTYEIELYYRTGSYVGVDGDASAWTLVGTAPMVTSAGVDMPTAVPIAVNITIPAGETYAWYLTSTNAIAGTDQVIYTDGVMEGARHTSDMHLAILEGRAKEYPFGASYFPRVFNGTVHYHACE